MQARPTRAAAPRSRRGPLDHPAPDLLGRATGNRRQARDDLIGHAVADPDTDTGRLGDRLRVAAVVARVAIDQRDLAPDRGGSPSRARCRRGARPRASVTARRRRRSGSRVGPLDRLRVQGRCRSPSQWCPHTRPSCAGRRSHQLGTSSVSRSMRIRTFGSGKGCRTPWNSRRPNRPDAEVEAPAGDDIACVAS